MNKKCFKTLIVSLVLLICVGASNIVSASADTFAIDKYEESFTPVKEQSALLNIKIQAVSADDGMIYIPINTKKPKLESLTVNGTVLPGKLLKIGSVEYFAANYGQGNSKVTIEATMFCQDFYKCKKAKTDTGIPSPLMDYKYVNSGVNKVKSYQLSIALPVGMEPIAVTAPAKVTAYKLGSNEDGLRTVELKTSVAAAGTARLAFTFDRPFTANPIFQIVMWTIFIVISCVVVGKRLKGDK